MSEHAMATPSASQGTEICWLEIKLTGILARVHLASVGTTLLSSAETTLGIKHTTLQQSLGARRLGRFSTVPPKDGGRGRVDVRAATYSTD